MKNTTLCYIESDGCYLMLHRVKKKIDVNKNKWIGIGGGFLENESPEDCIRREAMEETGLILGNLKLCGIISFIMENLETEHTFLFRCSDFSGELTECPEGILEWIPKDKIFDLELWEGDRIFLKMMEEDDSFFTLKLIYDSDGNLLSAVENGVKNTK